MAGQLAIPRLVTDGYLTAVPLSSPVRSRVMVELDGGRSTVRAGERASGRSLLKCGCSSRSWSCVHGGSAEQANKAELEAGDHGG